MALISSAPPTTSQTALKVTSSHRLVTTPPFAPRFSRLHRRNSLRCRCSRKNLDYIPKMFHEENLLDGLMDNYEDVPEYLYSRPYQQVNMSMAQDTTTTESTTSAGFYDGILGSLQERKETSNAGIRMQAAGRRRHRPPPDMPSHLLDARVVFLGMPLYESVTELITQQLIFLENHDSSKPIYLYIKSTGIKLIWLLKESKTEFSTTNCTKKFLLVAGRFCDSSIFLKSCTVHTSREKKNKDKKRQLIDSENGAFGIVDIMNNMKAKVHTINMGRAYGAAAMILSSGDKGNRVLLPHSLTRLHLPETFKINGPTTDMWIHVKDLEVTADMFLSVLSESVGKPKEEIAKDIRHGKYFKPQEAIDYGLADRIVHSVANTSFYPVALDKHAKNAKINTDSKAKFGRAPSAFGLG